MSEPSGRPAAGTRIGPYRIVRVIGGGGMGVVHEAVDETLGRPVALKLISPHLAEDEEFRRRFTREAQALAALDSPHVVHVYAHGEVDGRLYLATQLVPDGDLGSMLRHHGPPPTGVALDLVAQVAAGVADAHDAGLVHRDVKPANVLLRRRGAALSAYVGDFGIARRLSHDETDASRTGTVGTPAYMAPELHTGGSAGVRTDVYSLGCLLWATLTGQPPYSGTTDYQVASAHLDQPVPQMPGGSSRLVEVNRILRVALAKDPATRQATAAALRDELWHARSLPGDHPPASRRTLRRPHTAVAAAALAAALVSVVAWNLPQRAGEDGPAAAPTDPARGSPATAPAGRRGGNERAEATRNLVRALRAEDPALTRNQARCTATRWVDGVGLARLRAEGYFTEELAYVDVDISEASEETRLALTAATIACLAD